MGGAGGICSTSGMMDEDSNRSRMKLGEHGHDLLCTVRAKKLRAQPPVKVVAPS